LEHANLGDQAIDKPAVIEAARKPKFITHLVSRVMHWGLPKNWVSSGFEANKLQKLLSFPGAGDHGIFEKQPHAKCRTYPILELILF
jgi:hypothetical protein